MTLSSQATVQGTVQVGLPAPIPDSTNNSINARMWRYGEVATQPLMRKSHALADEGSYWVANSAQTGVAANYSTTYNATAGPFILIQNNNTALQRLYLDYIAIQSVVALVQTTAVGFTSAAMVIDSIPRWSSAGTNLSGNIVNPNMAAGGSPGILIYHGAIQALAASANARMIVGQRTLRPSISTTVGNVIGDQHVFNFGGVEGMGSGSISITAGQPNIMPQAFPPMILAPGHTFLLYLFFPVLTAPSAATYSTELGFWVR